MKTNQKTIDKVSMMYQYSHDTLMPYIYFYKYLAKRDEKGVKLWIPDSIVFNDLDLPPMWFYSSQDGYVYRTDSFTLRNVTTKFTDDNSNKLVAVLKKLNYKNLELVGNDVKPITANEFHYVIQGTARGELAVIQMFIKCNGPKPFICRTIWKKYSNSVAWSIYNKNEFSDGQYFTNTRTASIIPTQGKFLNETLPYVLNIAKWMKQQYQVEFSELGCDFIKQGNKWYFINVRGFQIEQCDSIPIQFKHITHDDPPPYKEKKSVQYIKTRECKFCEIVFPLQELTNKMTLKMILQTDLHLLHRNVKWRRNRLQHLDLAMLYQEFSVCDSCYTLYLACEDLMNLEFQFAKKLGMDQNQRYNLISMTHTQEKGINVVKPTQANSIVGNGAYYVMPKEWELNIENDTEIQITNNLQPLSRYRMIILITQTYNIESNWKIEYEWFQTKVKYPGNIQNACKLFYFFANNLEELLSENLKFLVIDNKGYKVGECELDLRDFISGRVIKREYNKRFSQYGINTCVGISSSGKCDTERIKLNEFKGVYLPEKSYYCCEPLPEEWMQMIKQAPTSKKKTQQEVRKQYNSFNKSYDTRIVQENDYEFKGRLFKMNQSFDLEDQQYDRKELRQLKKFLRQDLEGYNREEEQDELL